MQQNSALDWSYDRLNYSLRLRQVAANQRGVVPNTALGGVGATVSSSGGGGVGGGGAVGIYSSSPPMPIATATVNSRGGDSSGGLDYASGTGGLSSNASDGVLLMSSGEQHLSPHLSTSVPTSGSGVQQRIVMEQQSRPKSLKKQKKALSRSNSSLDEELRTVMAPHRDYGSTSSIDLLAKAVAVEEAAGVDIGGCHSGSKSQVDGPPGISIMPTVASAPGAAGSVSVKNRSVHFKSGSNKESSSSSRAFLKRFRNSAKSSSQQQQKQQSTLLADGNYSAGDSGGASSSDCVSASGQANIGVSGAGGSGSSASLATPNPRKNFFHFDCQSLMWQPFGDPLWRHTHRSSHRRRNTGASAASSGTRLLTTPVHGQSGAQTGGIDSDPCGNLDVSDARAAPQQLAPADDQDLDDCDQGDGQSNDIVLSCPFFRNELGGESLRVPCLTRYSLETARCWRQSHPTTFSLPTESGGTEENTQPIPDFCPQHCTPSCNAASLLEPLPGRELLGPDGRTPEEDEEEWGGSVSRHFWHSTGLAQRNGGLGTAGGAQSGGGDNLLMEFVDTGAKYYRKYFEGQAHQNWFGVDDEYGSMAISLKRERVSGGGVSPPPISDSDSFVALSCSGGSRSASAAAQSSQSSSSGGIGSGGSGVGSTYLWRMVVRTQRQLASLRGAIFEEHVPTQCKLSSSKGVPVKEVLQHVVPELPLSCLRLGNPEAVPKLSKLDEQLLPGSYKIGVLLCRSGQCCEEEMYNNEYSSPALEEFMNLLGQKIKLQSFDKFKGGLDNKTDMTGTHSYYTSHRGHEIMFHVSTMLPFTPSNQQQLMRKRHIGNDIVTIIFQEPGAMPFSAKTMRSQFQHIFIVVRAHYPNTDHTCYSIAISRSCDVPPFGPPIPHGATFSKSQEFVDFLLTKAMNGENAAHRSPKFLTMALRSREDNLKELAANFVHNASTLDSKAAGATTKFFLGSGRKKDKNRGRPDLALQARGALVWSVRIHDFTLLRDVSCLVGIGWDRLVIIDIKQRCVMVSLPCRAVIGWTKTEDSTVKVYYNDGEMLVLSHDQEDDLGEIMQRLDVVSPGCHTKTMSLERNEATNLGFSVHDGNLVVTSVDVDSPPSRQGLRQGSRVVELCGRPCSVMTSDGIQEVLRVAAQLTLTYIPPDMNNRVRKGVEIADPYQTNRAVSFLRKSVTPPPNEGISRQAGAPLTQSAASGNALSSGGGSAGTPSGTIRSQQSKMPSRDGERRHTVGHVKLSQLDETDAGSASTATSADVTIVNGADDATDRGFRANLRRLIDPDYTEDDIRNKAVSPSSCDPSAFGNLRHFGHRRPSGGPDFGTGPPLQRTISDESLIGTVSSPLGLRRLTSRVATEASLQQDWSRLVHEANQALSGAESVGSMSRRPHYSSASVHPQSQPPQSSQSSARQTPHSQGVQHSSNDPITGHSPRFNDLEKRCAELEAQVKHEREGREQAEAECERLRLENAHLRDECSKAAHQLTKFSSWFFSAMDRQQC